MNWVRFCQVTTRTTLAAVLAVATAACSDPKHPTGSGWASAAVPSSSPGAIDDSIVQKMKNQAFEKYDGPFRGRMPAPNISSYRQDPVNALGSIIARVAKRGKTCMSPGAGDFEMKRLIEQRPIGCMSKTYPAATVAQMLVDGKAAADIDYVVGKANVNAEFAFEFMVSEPVTAVLPETDKCIQPSDIAALQLEPNTCDLLYVTGVVITQVTYRQFRRLSASASFSYVVKVGGEAYGSSESLVNKWYMTVDTVDLSRFFEANPTTGALGPTNKKNGDGVKPTSASTLAKVTDVVLKEGPTDFEPPKRRVAAP